MADSFIALKAQATFLGIKATGVGRTRDAIQKDINEALARLGADEDTVTAPKAAPKPARVKAVAVPSTGPVLFYGYSAAKIRSNPFILFSNWAFTPFVDGKSVV